MNDDPGIVALIERVATTGQREWLQEARQLAGNLGFRLFLVGGAVRDLLVEGSLRDLDLVVEGDGMELARRLAERLGASLRLHDRFLTGELWNGHLRMDIVSARREEYPEPAALPRVSPGTLMDDLARRDFTVNSMAVALFPSEGESLIDPFAGRRDLKVGQLRVLHPQSFLDDPTRILRGVRLGSRLGFVMEPETQKLAAAAVTGGAIEALSPDRLRHELVPLLEASESIASLRWLERLGALVSLGLVAGGSDVDWQELERLAEVRSSWGGRLPPLPPVRWWFVHLLCLAQNLEAAKRYELAARLGLDSGLETTLVGTTERLTRIQETLKDPGLKPHRVRREIDALEVEETALLWTRSAGQVRAWVESWVDVLRLVDLQIRGSDLIAEGFQPGPRIGEALVATLDARIDGEVPSADELEFALRLLRQETRS